MVERRQSLVSRTIKHCLPRRESERRAHPLARHCEILSALETRISMLSMTFMKFIETGLCCFIPGKIIDEILHILKVVQGSASPPRTHDLLQELRDISSMAMEHFEEHIVPSLRESDVNNAALTKSFFQSPGFSRTGRPINVSDIRKEFKMIQQNTKMYRQQLGGMRKTFFKLNAKVKSQGSVIAYQACKLREQRRLINEQSSAIADMKKHLEEWDRKFADLSAEVIRQKSTENKASQTTNEFKSEITKNASSILKDLNDTFPSIRPETISAVADRIIPNHSIFDELNKLSQHIYTNIRPRSSLAYKYLHRDESPLPPKPREHEWYSKPIHLPNRRITISDFRAKQENAPDCRTKTDHSTDSAAKMLSRKRKIIDLIAKVADSKISKQSSTTSTEIGDSNSDITPQQHSSSSQTDRSRWYTNEHDIIATVSENLKGKKRLQNESDDSDEIPHKRSVVGNFRSLQ